MTPRRLLAAGSLLVVALVAGCGHTGSRAAPAPATLTRAQAATVYARAASDYNTAAFDLTNELTSDRPALAELHARGASARDAAHRFLVVLQRTGWPADITQQATALGTCTTQDVSYFSGIATSPSVAAALAATVPDCGASQTELIRSRLGLPAP